MPEIVNVMARLESHRKYYQEHKEHCNKQAMLWQKNHLEKTRKIHKDYIQRIKHIVLTHYGNGKLACVRCGFSDIRALTIDHIEGIGSITRKKEGGAGYNIWSHLKRDGYPKGYQTLCMNCQWIKKFEEGEFCGYALSKSS